jgi:succinate-semialdehyde dehydrogenase / glutarate-semialdehyde dehydrogenase
MNLTSSNLFKTEAYINGKWVNVNKTYEVINPSTQQKIADVAYCSEIECNDAINAAAEAFKLFKQTTANERSLMLLKMANLMLEHQNDLATILTTEQGKPYHEAKLEVGYAASFFSWYAGEALRITGDVIQNSNKDSKVLVTKEPIGVVAAITPWNFPLAMLTRKVGAAIAAGCTVVWKPSEETPLSANAMGVISQIADIPNGVINIVSGNAVAIGDTIMKAKAIKKITFTGSTRTGKILLKGAADTVKRVSMELGGNAPFIVFADANLDDAVNGAMSSKFRNAGQVCIAANRFYIHKDIFSDFTTKLQQKIKELNVGDGFMDNVNIGPLINQNAVKKVKAHILDAVNKGAKALCGGESHQLGGNFFQPTILVGMTPDMLIAKEETFGPVAACFSFETDEEVISMANDTDFGLAAYFYSKNISRIFNISNQLEYGMIGVNETSISSYATPFGGIKESGYGREGSIHGIEDYISLKYNIIKY